MNEEKVKDKKRKIMKWNYRKAGNRRKTMKKVIEKQTNKSES